MVCSCFNALLSRRKHHQHSEQETGFSSDKNVRLISYDELRSATDNFHQSNKIGRGGFGTVYKGTLRNRVAIAVKVLSAESKQGVNEFLTEIDAIANVRHPNLVELIGCCAQGSSRILVYEYMENSSLDRALLGLNIDDTSKLNWKIRSAVCIGTAKGLAYLHEELEPPIVHRDIKASNILLDSDFAPKIGDFGLAKLFPDNVTHISTRVAGTTGYLAPEYAMQGQLTKKADVYSFGVLVIEIISSRSSSKTYWSGLGQSLLEWTWQLFVEGRIKEVIDPALQEYPEEQVLRFLKVGLFCTQASAGRRPSMPQVVEMLSKPMKLNEKELTPPGVVGGSFLFKNNRVPKATNSSNTQFNESTSSATATATATAVASPSNPSFLTQMIPR
ncbi:putative serine/threonine-protein kinase isoform X2 [Musa acuminata AAA Group]|uniref:putative serine/threonine-protein kinase isoform X2 n=1 Tax=Musa acuminata AAA Group TaxID=214697 RepID=UPI0031E1465C